MSQDKIKKDIEAIKTMDATPPSPDPVIPAVSPTDPMATLAPAAIFDSRDSSAGPSIEVTTTHFDPSGLVPGIGADGLALNHRYYITPDPSMDYRFCTNDSRRVGRNRARGWSNVKVDGNSISVGNMTLCQRPKTLGDQHRANLVDQALRRSKKARADAVKAANPGLEGSERVEVVSSRRDL